ncbi:MAG: glycosyltransferase family 4 protein [Candidatus Heimdallarchaeota archaeon]|nr:glycosyltransferase family 4 protein [Candidatus Heimdallarchaeota archaeon]
MVLNITMLFELGPNDEGVIGGGVELHAINLSKELVKLGHNVTYLTGAIPNSKRDTIIDGVNIKRIDYLSLISKAYDPQQLNFSRQLFFLLKTKLLRKKARDSIENSDIFHGHIYSSGLAAYCLSKKRKAKAINTIHGSYYKYWNELTRNPFAVWFYKGMERRIAPLLARKTDYQIHTDFDFAETVKKWCKPKNAKKVVTVLNGVDIQKFNYKTPPKPTLSEEEGPVIMTTRRLVVKNGVIFLARSFKKIIEKYPSAKLYIIGDGPEKNNIYHEVQSLGLEENVNFVGMVPNDSIPSFLSGADIVVVPSIVEASSISVLEAMAMKKPIVASDIPGIREITKKGEHCILVKSKDTSQLADGILRLLKDKETSERIAQLGFNEVTANFSWKKKAKEIEQIYFNALEH